MIKKMEFLSLDGKMPNLDWTKLLTSVLSSGDLRLAIMLGVNHMKHSRTPEHTSSALRMAKNTPSHTPLWKKCTFNFRTLKIEKCGFGLKEMMMKVK